MGLTICQRNYLQLKKLLYAVNRQQAAKSTTETDRGADCFDDDELERRQAAVNKAGRKKAMKTGGGSGQRAPDQIDPDEPGID